MVTGTGPGPGVTEAELARKFRRLYHMAEDGSWASIRRHGLLSTTALLDLYGVNGDKRLALEARHRAESMPINHPTYGRAVVRDQKPMSDDALRRCLQDGLTPERWYRILNSKVFFWLTEERLERLLGAAAYADRTHDVIVLDTESLLAAHAPSVSLAPMNTGCTRPFPHKRGLRTFQALATYPYCDRRRRGLEVVIELAVEGGVRDVESHVIEVRSQKHGTKGDVIWRPGDG